MKTNHKMKTKAGEPVRLFHFDGMSQMADYLQSDCKKALENYYPGDWEGGSWEEADQRCRLGQNDLVKASEKLLDVMETQARMDTTAFKVFHSVAGGAVNVPAMLTGHPRCMRLRRRVLTQEAPVVVLASQWIWAGCSQAVINRRGAAILALVRKLQEFRPVSLHVYIGLGSRVNSLTAFEVETAPMDLARAAWALGSPNVIRHYGHAFHGKANNAYNGYDGGYQLYQDAETVADLIGAEEWIATPNLTSDEFDTDEKAAAWVLEQLKIHAGSERAVV